MRDYLRLLRVHQYSKNVFIFFPAFFAGEILNAHKMASALVAFMGFSLLASSVYILNDCRDAPFDREHPRKKSRPIASGAISVARAVAIALILLCLGLASMYLTSPRAAMFLLAYLVLNVLYSLGLKHLPIIDVSIIAAGFVLRIFVGAAVTAVELTEWIVIMTYLLALFLALAKRRDDVFIYERTGKMMRQSIDGYNSRFLDTSLAIMAAIVIVSYLMYTLSHDVTERIGSRVLYLTAPFVIAGVMRHLQLTLVEEKSGSPTRVLLNDRFTQINLLCWIAAFGLIIYGQP